MPPAREHRQIVIPLPAAKEAMFHFTDIEVAPWTVIKSNDKSGGRINALRHVLTTLGYTGRDLEWIGQPDPLLVVYAADII